MNFTTRKERVKLAITLILCGLVAISGGLISRSFGIFLLEFAVASTLLFIAHRLLNEPALGELLHAVETAHNRVPLQLVTLQQSEGISRRRLRFKERKLKEKVSFVLGMLLGCLFIGLAILDLLGVLPPATLRDIHGQVHTQSRAISVSFEALLGLTVISMTWVMTERWIYENEWEGSLKRLLKEPVVKKD